MLLKNAVRMFYIIAFISISTLGMPKKLAIMRKIDL